MGKIALQIKANMENVTDLKPDGDDFRWYFKLKCESCGEVSSSFQFFTKNDEHELKGNRSFANLVSKCKLCSRQNSINVISETIAAYSSEDSENQKFKTVAVFDCRGMAPVEYQFSTSWVCQGTESGTKFAVEFEDNEWGDYDEKAKESCGITELEHRFVAVK